MAAVNTGNVQRGGSTPASLMSTADLKSMLESEHPLYTKNKKWWQDIQNLYLNEEIDTFIFRHQREKEPNWLRRRERSYIYNYVQSIVDLKASFIYSKSIERTWQSPEEREKAMIQIRQQQIYNDAAKKQEQQQQEQEVARRYAEAGQSPPPPQNNGMPADPDPLDVEEKVQQLLSAQGDNVIELQEFWKDVDIRGTHIDDFSKLLFVTTQLFGHVDAFIDMPINDKEIKNERDRKQENIRPYAFIIFPMDLLNWEMGPDGRFLWVRWREKITGNVKPFAKRSKQTSWRYFTWTREEWFVHEVSYEGDSAQPSVRLVDEGENPIGEVPLVRFFNKKHLAEPSVGVSAMRDIAKINIEILNLLSLIDEEVYQKCLNILVMQSPADKKGAIEIGQNNVLLWEGEQQPYYLAPASDPGNFMLELIKTCIQEIYRVAKLGGDTGVQEAQSGIAYTWEFNQTNRMLADAADMMERGENELHRVWCLWMNTEWHGYIKYPDNFNVERFEDEIKRVVDIKQAVRSPEFKKIQEKQVANRAMGSKVPPQDRARVMAEIDVLPEEKQNFFPPFGQ